MDFLNKITIKSRMVLAFALMLIVFVLFALFAISEMNELDELTTTLYEHPLQVSNAALKAKAGVIRMHRSMKDVALSRTELELENAIQAVQSEEKIVYQNLAIVKTQILGKEGKNVVQAAIELFSGWKPIRVEVEELVLEGNRVAAGRITKGKGAEYVFSLERKMVELTSYAINKADDFMEGAHKIQRGIIRNTIIIIGLVAILSFLIAFFMIKSILSSVSSLRNTMSEITKTGSLSKSDLVGDNEITEMAQHFNRVIERLEGQFWLKDGQTALSDEMSGDLSFEDLVTKTINFVSRYVDACIGALYVYNKKESVCELKASYAFVEGKYLSNEFKLGEGVVGQVAVEKKPILLKGITKEEALGKTGTISEPPKSIYAIPLLYEEKLYGVMEMASFEEIDRLKMEFLDTAARIVSIALYTVTQGEEIKALLETTQNAKEQLEAQAEELQSQAEELQQTSDELQEQNIELETQQHQVEDANRLKSEFLSNMSHELRTPLNSVMALSRVLLMQSKDKLSEEEAGYLEIIERNGKRLLSLINDILDLSKIEAGKMDLNPRRFSLAGTIEVIIESLDPISGDKGIEMIQDLPPDLPEIETDEERVHQILQNLIGNAIKFTDKGSVSVSAQYDETNFSIRVQDTGIGISEKDLTNIFEEFRQVDGSTARQYEGTGLGLAIAKKATTILGGTLSVTSTLGKGSSFILTLPILWKGEAPEYEPLTYGVSRKILPEQKTILVVDDEPEVATMISGFLSTRGYNVIAATSGKEALGLAKSEHPFAITLDIFMPDMDGWEVLQELKQDPDTAHIPVIVVSVTDDKQTGFALGAVGYITKPVNRDALIAEINKVGQPGFRTIMIVDDNEIDRQEMARIIEEKELQVIAADSGLNCLKMIEQSLPDVLILDLMMPGMDGFEVLDRLHNDPQTANLPVIVVTAKDLTAQDRKKLSGHVSSVLEKSKTTSRRLLEEITKILSEIEDREPHAVRVSGSKDRVLLVEDSDAVIIQVKTVLQQDGYEVDVAKNGQEALDYVQHTIPDGIVLDLMMPEVDGFEVLEKIRSRKETANIPVLVLTAKDLTMADRKKLTANHIQQLIQKGDMDQEGLLSKVREMLGKEMLEPKGKVPASEPAPIRRSKGEKRPTILAVEDNPDNMTTIRALLGESYNLLEATDGQKGLTAVLEQRPDLILLDMSLPEMDGFQVVREIKENKEVRGTPVIAMTAHAMKGDREKILEAGCDDYISKPIEPEGFLEKINKWLGK